MPEGHGTDSAQGKPENKREAGAPDQGLARRSASKGPTSGTQEARGGGPAAVYSLTPFTMLDYPDHLACIVWLAGCNFRCKYCHNPEMVCGKNEKPWAEVVEFLQNRKGKLTGVVFSGGEATLHPQLPEFAAQVKAMGFKVKLDTNGTRPEVIRQLAEANVLDMVAMDYKAPPEKFADVTQVAEKLYHKFTESVEFLVTQPHIRFEIRTTVHTGLLTEDDVAAIREDLAARNYAGTYFVQNYRDTETVGNIGPQLRPLNQKALEKAVTTADKAHEEEVQRRRAQIHIAYRNFG